MNNSNNDSHPTSAVSINPHLHSELLAMMKFIQEQFISSMEALNEGDIDKAQSIIECNAEIKQYEISLDNQVISTITNSEPTAGSELRSLITISKIVAELEKFGNEIKAFSEFIIILYDPNTSDPNTSLLKDIIVIGEQVKTQFTNLIDVIANQDCKLAYAIIESDRDYELELQEGIKHQLDLVVHNSRMIRRGLDILQMMKSLERCGEHCRNIAEFMILMIDGMDIRHIQAT